MKIEEIRKLSDSEIKEKIYILQKKLFDNKIKIDLTKIKDTSVLKKNRKIISRMKTIIREREILKEHNNR
ncbi:50S ribosomal protein L29 [Candidatus Phytoplasma sacchari]|uniref:Large ribosomal subunit protein uL29 n=1 Tax=Candidatus Phytoplasma sacchari TaxID=2609813 RepID=A0ABY7M488_9MOLU|nr:50S ribosomal protein L29 [Candidatus Phytoplasma sacchari]